MIKFFNLTKFFFVIIFTIAYQTSAHSLSNFKQHMGQGELKLSKDTFELIEFYFSTGKYGAIYNNPKYDWQRKMIKSVWRPEFMIISKNGKGRFWYYSFIGSEIDTTPSYIARARGECKKQGYGECFVFAIKNKIVWQNGINPKKGTKIKKKDAKNGMVLTKLKELGFYDGGITQTPKTTKKKIVKDDDIVKKLQELNNLLESGVISAEEFEKAKKKLLE